MYNSVPCKMLFQNTRKSQWKLKEVRLNILINSWDVVKEVSQISFIYTFNYSIFTGHLLCAGVDLVL